MNVKMEIFNNLELYGIAVHKAS